MSTNDDKQKGGLTIPNAEMLPDKVLEMINKSSKPSPTRSLVFETDKQRMIGMLQKGVNKPGMVSFEVLRRAANAVAVARICINVLKEKVTKTKWVIKAIDPLAKVDEEKVKKITKLLKKPNNTDTWRSFIDKLIEDLLILDELSIEKTRYEDGTLAELYYVDSATIRPIYDEYGNNDVPIQLHTKEGTQMLPVSYLQIFNNSMYGGPESGDIVAAWPSKDFIRECMHPQGSTNNFGYGLSPLEGVLGVVNNLLNSDNFNGSYFDEGAFPPLIMQLTESMTQRDLEAYREYMYQELSGNFHRPAIMAGGGELKVHNLKDLNNRDMQFMEYTLFLSKLLCVAYGLSPDDIGLTDTTGSKAVSETQKDLSEAKGYGSILHFITEIINTQIIGADFDAPELEFEFIQQDSTDPEVASKIYDVALRNGTMTLNEVREKMGELPYEDWADQAMILGTEGYTVIHTDEHHEGSEETVEKSQSPISKAVYTQSGFKTWMDDRGYGQPFIVQDIKSGGGWVIKPPVAVNLYSQDLEIELTGELAATGHNVKPAVKMLYTEVCNLFGSSDIQLEFDKYVNMTPEYDSEKWRARHGGSRKFPYYVVTAFIDGFNFNSQQIRDDMKRDPESYVQAITDLAKLWNIEKEMVLGDRRPDQYIITPDKRAFGFDYQFKGDYTRWESSSTAIAKILITIPMLYKLFTEKTAQKETKKSIFKTIIEKAIEVIQNKKVHVLDHDQIVVAFGAQYDENNKASVTKLFESKDTKKITAQGYTDAFFNYEWEAAVKALKALIDKNVTSSGGVISVEDERGLKFCAYYKE